MGMNTNTTAAASQTIIRVGNRAVVINDQDGNVWACLYVNARNGIDQRGRRIQRLGGRRDPQRPRRRRSGRTRGTHAPARPRLPLETECEDADLTFEPEAGTITGSIRVVRKCGECGDELKEANFDIEQDTGLGEVELKAGEEVEVEADTPEPSESGGGRYAKNMVGFSVNVSVYKVLKSGEKVEIWQGEIADNMPASGFDELC